VAPSSGETKGVGLAFHPLLRRSMEQGRLPTDFVETALESYLDPARTALLDPGERSLRRIAARGPIVWRSSAFSLGSVEDPAKASCDTAVLRRFLRLCEVARPSSLIETIGFRRIGARDLGRARPMPRNAAAADWLAARCRALRNAVGVPVMLQFGKGPDDLPKGEMSESAFLERIAERTECEFVLDVEDVERVAREQALDPRETATQFAGLPVAALTLSGARHGDWDLLDVALAAMAPRAIVLRRLEHLYPLDEIAAHLHRAASALGRVRARPAREVRPPAPVATMWEPAAAAELRDQQLAAIDDAFARPADPKAMAWRNWRQRVEETYKGQQIKTFLSA